jgi:GntR family transcriptional regulator/MocR family aminotransferase
MVGPTWTCTSTSAAPSRCARRSSASCARASAPAACAPARACRPSRTLARDLGVSRGVVVEAYAQLVAEGWLSARRGAGTEVAAAASRPVPAAAPARPERDVAYDLRTGSTDLSAFPRAAWHAAVGRALRDLPDAALGYGDPRGHAPLRTALAAHIGRTRGAVADPERIVVCGGLAQGLHVVWRALGRHGAQRIAVEDPGWRGQRRSVEDAGLAIVPVPVDADGLVVDAIPEGVDAVAVTPAHQFPTGAVLAPERRAQLVSWARATGGVIIEDDYDAEYRYDRDPVGAVQGLAPEHVIYTGSASKTLAPALRLGWLVLPDRLLADAADVKDRMDRGTPVLEQAAFADLLERGEVDRHLRRTRRSYRARRDALVEALHEHLGGREGFRIGGAAAGLHLVVDLPPDADEAAVAAAALERGVAVDVIGATRMGDDEHPPALLLGYASSTEPALRRAAAQLGAAVAAAAG